MRKVWTHTELELLTQVYKNTPWPDIEKMFPNRTHDAIKTKAISLGIKRDKSFKKRKSNFWTQEKDEVLKSLYQTNTANETAKIMGLSKSVVKNRIFRLRLKKNENTGRYPKGHVPHNKGKKGFYFHGSEKGWFKKGNRPHNYKPVGYIRLTKDGYYEVKTSDPKTWEALHRIIWQKHHEEDIKDDEIIIFIDGNAKNIHINNLKKINRKQHAENTRNTDGYILRTITRDEETKKQLLKHPEIISLKRTILKLNKAIKDGEK